MERERRMTFYLGGPLDGLRARGELSEVVSCPTPDPSIEHRYILCETRFGMRYVYLGYFVVVG